MRQFKMVNTTQWMESIKDLFGDDIPSWELKLPKRGTKWSAGYDFFAPFDFTLYPNEEIKIPTGIKAEFNPGEVLFIFPRSSLGFKYYARIANTIPVIDADYQFAKNDGHIFIKIRNEGDKRMDIFQGDALCQGIFTPFLLVDSDDFETGEDRVGGIGSTNKERS